jgi:hypothetical protein
MATLPGLVQGIHEITPAERAHLLGELARAVSADLAGRSEGAMLTDHCGKPVGLFLPVAQNPSPPPPMTDEDRAELQRRLDTIDNSVTTKELKARIARGGAARPSGS